MGADKPVSIFGEILNRFPVGVLCADISGNIIDFNRVFAEMLSTPPANLWELIPQREHFLNNLHLHKKVVLEIRYLPQSGQIMLLKIDAALFKDGTEILMVVENITRRRQIEDNLRRSEKRYRAFFSAAPDAVFIIDLRGFITDCNDAAVKLSGYTRNKLIGMRLDSLLPESEPAKFLETILSYAGSTDCRTMELLITSGDNNKHDMEMVVSPFMLGASPYAVMIIMRDITKRKKTEARLQETMQLHHLLIENSPDIIFTLDLNGRFINWNPKAAEFAGIPQGSDVDFTLKEILSPESLIIAMKKIAEKVRTLSPSMPYEVMARRADGEWVLLEIISFPIIENGEVVAVQGIARDISSRKHS